MKGVLVVDQGLSFGFWIFNDGDRVEHLWLMACSGVAVAAGYDAGFFRVLGEKFGGQSSFTVNWPRGSMRWNTYQVSRRLCSVMALNAQDRAVGIVVSAVMLDVIECNWTDLRLAR